MADSFAHPLKRTRAATTFSRLRSLFVNRSASLPQRVASELCDLLKPVTTPSECVRPTPTSASRCRRRLRHLTLSLAPAHMIATTPTRARVPDSRHRSPISYLAVALSLASYANTHTCTHVRTHARTHAHARTHTHKERQRPTRRHRRDTVVVSSTQAKDRTGYRTQRKSSDRPGVTYCVQSTASVVSSPGGRRPGPGASLPAHHLRRPVNSVCASFATVPLGRSGDGRITRISHRCVRAPPPSAGDSSARAPFPPCSGELLEQEGEVEADKEEGVHPPDVLLRLASMRLEQ